MLKKMVLALITGAVLVMPVATAHATPCYMTTTAQWVCGPGK